MRKTTPAAGRPARYPRLRAAWTLLALAPAVAHADLTVTPRHPTDPNQPPNDTRQRPLQPEPPPKPEPPKLEGKMACPLKPKPSQADPRPAVKPHLPPPMLNGGLARAVAPSAWQVSNELAEDGLVIHPHGPDEPCEPILRARTRS